MSSSVTAACTETSRAETGSSATTTLALPAKARATPMRCFWPPESWRGLRCSKRRGSFTRSSSSSILWCRSAASLPTLNFSSVRMICEPTVWLGFSVSNGFWNTIWIEETVFTSRISIPVDWISLLPSLMLPPLAVSRPSSILARVDLPQPDSPTIARISASQASKVMDSLAITLRVSPPNSALAAAA